MDNANNDNTQRANKRDDLHDILRTFVDDPNNEVKTYCVSPFIELESVESVLKKHKGNFCVLSLNIQSLNSKFDSFMSVLSHLNDNNTHFQAICLQETWLSHDQDTSLFNIPGYHLIHRGKSRSNHSGLIIYLSDEFSYNVKDTLPGSQLWDGLFIDVYGESLCGNLTIGNIYRPPRHNNNNNTVRQFCSELQPVISNISKHDSNAIITGDFNIDLLQINERSEFQKYFDLFTTDGLFPCITLPTRSSESLIDQIYCKLKDPKQLVFSCVIDTMISDHYPCFAIVDILKSRKHKPKFVQIHNHDPAAFRSFMRNCQRDFKMCPSILIYVLIRMITMNCLNRLWWTPSPNILLQKLLDLKSTNIGFPRGSLMVFCVPSNIEINCFGKYDAFQMEQTSIHHCR